MVKYQTEFNTILNRKIYYIPFKFPATKPRIISDKGIIQKTDMYPLYRTLPSEMKRKKYYSKNNIDVVHWGQRKLLLSEIEFLTLFLSEYTDKKPIHVVYAGSAPGTHILYLSKLFPMINFELYDPRDFDTKLKSKRIKTHKQYFTDDTANEWRSSKHLDKTILFISDIRTGDVSSMSSEEVEVQVKIDNQRQIDWYNIIMPKLSMFKFRLPYDSDNKTPYLDGDIYIQAYAPTNSTETRLIVGENAQMKIYDDREFEEQMFYFNNHERIRNYDNLLYKIPIKKKYGIRNDYDGASEVYILEKYLSISQPKSENIILHIIRMINEISKELSENITLFSKKNN